jgi:hypothetical protein
LWTWSNTLRYDFRFADNHHIEFLLGAETIKNKRESFSAFRTNFLSDDFDNRYLNGGTGLQTNNGSASSWALTSQFVKMNYGIFEKYFIEAVVQRERSLLFPSTDRPSIHSAFSAAWMITEESFAESVDAWLSYAKLRAGWGKNSNQTNVGFDAMLVGGKLDISVDWYTRNSKAFKVPVGYYITYGNFAWLGGNLSGKDSLVTLPSDPVVREYLGEVTNRGIDLTLNYYGTAIAGELRYTVGLNFSTYQNNVKMPNADVQFFGFNDERIQNFVVTQSGHPISSYFGYVIESVFKSDAEASSAPLNMLGANQNKAGRFQYKDVNGDGIINSGDATIIGSPHPDFTYGISIQVNYRNFGLTLFGHGVHGNDIFNYVKYWTDFPTSNGNRSKRVLDNSWRPDNQNASLPQLVSSDGTSILPSTYYVENGSYFRMKNIQLDYSIPTYIVTKAGIKGVRFFIQAQNLFTITHYSGLDPEVNLKKYTNGDQQIGVDGGIYPAAKQYLVGVNVRF